MELYLDKSEVEDEHGPTFSKQAKLAMKTHWLTKIHKTFIFVNYSNT